MFYHLNDHVYAVNYNNEIIILDTVQDNYIIVNDKAKTILEDYLSKGVIQTEVSDSSILSIIKYFNDNNILSSSYFSIPCGRIKKIAKKLQGAPNLDWRLEKNELLKRTSNILIVEAYIVLCIVHRYIKKYSLYKLIVLLRKYRNVLEKNNILSNQITIEQLAIALNKACLVYPSKVKCLEWAAALTLMGLRRKLKCNLVIGIQNLPFMAHAWVEYNSTIICDTPELSKQLAIVLKEPFAE
jgi:translation initiation factor 6 (eIF-6)